MLGLLAGKAGVDITETVPIASKDPQSAYTPVIQQMKNDGDNYNLTGAPVDNVISMRNEAQLPGPHRPEVRVDLPDPVLRQEDQADAGDVMANTHIVMNFLPFTETKANKTLANFVKYVGRPTRPTASRCGAGCRRCCSSRRPSR